MDEMRTFYQARLHAYAEFRGRVEFVQWALDRQCMTATEAAAHLAESSARLSTALAATLPNPAIGRTIPGIGPGKWDVGKLAREQETAAAR